MSEELKLSNQPKCTSLTRGTSKSRTFRKLHVNYSQMTLQVDMKYGRITETSVHKKGGHNQNQETGGRHDGYSKLEKTIKQGQKIKTRHNRKNKLPK